MYLVMLGSFFFNDTATTEIYTLSLHDALPIYDRSGQTEAAGQIGSIVSGSGVACPLARSGPVRHGVFLVWRSEWLRRDRSEEHTSELQSRQYLVCRLLLEKKTNHTTHTTLSSR